MLRRLHSFNVLFQTVAAGLISWCSWATLVHSQQTTSPASAATMPGGINDPFLDPQLDPCEWTDRFEVESREVFTARQAIVRAVGLKPGDIVADVGAGTGLYTVLFAQATGPHGWVYAVDIAPRFIEHISTRASAAGIANVTPVLCTQTSVCLPPASIDTVFVCDTYHHFEHPEATLASIQQALRPNGRLIVVDFKREEGVSSEWVMNHVRAGKEVVIAEVEAAGFRRLGEPPIPGLIENYLVVFQKSSSTGKK